MRRGLMTHGVCLFVGSIVTLAIVLWLQRGLGHAVAEGYGHGAAEPIGGDVNGDGRLDVSDGIYILNYVFRGGPLPVPSDCPTSGLPATGQTKCYDTDGNDVDCASASYPGQDGFYQTGCSISGRFVDNGDGTVTDTCTGLSWQKATADVKGGGTVSTRGDEVAWLDALAYCDGLSFAGHEDWRLPDVRELQSIADYGRSQPALDPIFDAKATYHWSSSTWLDVPSMAWFVCFWDGYVGYSQAWKESAKYFVLAVRNAQ